ncbi:MAG: T9SS type A sorting domain-containing protein [Paludibacter sp.]
MKKLLLFVAVTICAVQAYSQTTYNVSSTGTNSGTSWTTVRAAIAAASSGDIIQLSAETFTEKNIIFPTVNSVVTPKSLTIKGSGMNQTIIQADATTTIAQAQDCGVFKLDAAYSSGITITIQDMTIQNAYNSFSGGGLRLSNTGTQANAPTLNLKNLKISANRSTYGGGIYIAGAAILNITSCNITGNSMTSSTNMGGGIAVSPGTGFVAAVTIKNSTISANSSVGNGGGIAINCGANGTTAAANYLWIENSTIYGNNINTTSAKNGGGVYFKACLSGQTSVPTFTLTMNHCTIVNNTTVAGNGTTTSGPDGVCVENSSGYATTIVMNNSIIMGNSGSTGANACQIGSNNTSTSTTANGKITASPVITNSIFGIIASGAWTTTTNNNKLDAVMADLAFVASLSSDATPVLKMGGSSIARNYVSTNYLSPALTTDELGYNRDLTPDAGAYEFSDLNTAVNTPVRANFVTVTGRELRFSPVAESVEVYAQDGRLIKTSYDSKSTMLNNGGVYIVKIYSPKGVYTQKIIVY